MSLRWRIAATYAALFVIVIAVAGVAVSAAFRTILTNQAALQAQSVAAAIRRTLAPFGLMPAGSDRTIAALIATPGNLEGWSSPTTLVQIDTAQGQPLGKSGNTGSFFFPPDGRLSRQTPVRTYTLQTSAGELLVVDEALVENGRIVAVAHVGERLDAVAQILANARTILIVATVVATVFVTLASFLIASIVLGPIKRLTAAMEETGSEQLGRRIGWSERKDELGRLASAFDRMLDRLQAAFARERQFISDASHELKTPLTVINANAQMLRRWAERDEKIRGESLGAIIDESAGLASMVNGMLLLAKADSGEFIPKEPVDVDATARDAVDALRGKAEAKNLSLRYVSSNGGAIVYGEGGLLRQLFLNLIDNAIKFTETGGVTVHVARQGDEVTGQVIDTGPGVDEAAAARIFDRFYRADKSRSREVEGTGLGLAIVRSIVRVHNGRISVGRPPGGGSVFTVTLPAESVPAPPTHIESQ
ncbi:MAG: HAMP domain-containing histidine kinase [Candidatus Eremiobacteraeota bacterium]|nr:HAMP domain-containing histidine kinase [Candidatus Eremiobacteraeota bacterium]MBV8354545.1 HAMP domain-containing histidine kinase [Candidatus Eremiobacteraeota bacterium]